MFYYIPAQKKMVIVRNPRNVAKVEKLLGEKLVTCTTPDLEPFCAHRVFVNNAQVPCDNFDYFVEDLL